MKNQFYILNYSNCIISQNSAIPREGFHSHHLIKRLIESIRVQRNGGVNN